MEVERTAAGGTVREGLRAALPAAIKARDSAAVAALRSALAAIDNAEAVDAGQVRAGAWQESPVGVAAAEVERRVLDDAQLRDIVRAEAADRQAAAADYDRAGRHERAARLRREAAVLATHLGDPESAG